MAHDFQIDIRRLRTSLLVWLSARHWRRQTVFFGGGLAVGAAAVALAKGADAAQWALERILSWWPTAPLVITPMGYALAAYVTMRWFNGAQGSGIPQIIAANELPSTSLTRGAMVSMRVAIGKAFLLIFLLACGASIGREGPSVQIGAALMLFAGRLGGIRREGALLLAGGAAGVAGAFNTPLAGVVFAIEELGRRYEQRTNGTVILAVMLAGVASVMLAGNYTYFGRSAANLSGWPDILAVVVCGVVGGALGGLFSQLLVWGIVNFPRLWRGWTYKRMALFAGACGLVVGVIGLATNGATFGTGYSQAKDIIQVTSNLPWYFGPLKLIVTLLSSMCGIPGGLFAPSLSAGAGFGHALEPLLPMVPPATVALLGVVGYFSGVVQSPLTAFVIVMEMTGDHNMMLPLMATSLLGFAVSRMVCKYPIYHAIARSMVRSATVKEGLKLQRASRGGADKSPKGDGAALM